MKTIYVAETVYSELGTDDKFHIKTRIQAFADLEDAKTFADNEAASFKGLSTLKLKFVTVHKIEEVVA